MDLPETLSALSKGWNSSVMISTWSCMYLHESTLKEVRDYGFVMRVWLTLPAEGELRRGPGLLHVIWYRVVGHKGLGFGLVEVLGRFQERSLEVLLVHVELLSLRIRFIQPERHCLSVVGFSDRSRLSVTAR
jgi:hypothetical protein